MSDQLYHCKLLGQAVREARQKTGDSQQKYGKRCMPHVHKTTIGKIENGLPVRVSLLHLVARVAKIDLMAFEHKDQGDPVAPHEFYLYVEHVAGHLPPAREREFMAECWRLLCEFRQAHETHMFSFS